MIPERCIRCDLLMIGRWSPWCFGTMRPLLFVDTCPMEEDDGCADRPEGRR